MSGQELAFMISGVRTNRKWHCGHMLCHKVDAVRFRSVSVLAVEDLHSFGRGLEQVTLHIALLLVPPRRHTPGKTGFIMSQIS